MTVTCPEETIVSVSPDEATPALRVIVYGPDAGRSGFDVLADEWNDLLADSRVRSIFLTYEWQTTWWRALGHGELWILAFRCPASGKLVGIAPLFLTQEPEFAGRRHFHLVGCIEVSDYLDLIVRRDWEEIVYLSLLEWLDGPDAPAWDRLDLCNLPQESLAYQTLPELARSTGHNVEVLQEDVAPKFSLPPRYETYLNERVEKKQRHEIRRKQRRAERETTVGFTIVGPNESLEAEVDDFITLQRASDPEKAEFMTSEMRRFFHAIARAMFDAGYLRLCFLTLNGDKAAALLAFEYKGQFLLYNSGYDPDAYSQLSPGWVILGYAIQYAIVSGCTEFDFMQGDEEYKYRFGSKDYRVMRTLICRKQAE
ncbi:MAG: GNAT family N-acetyltransferase [Caldilineaceae bacterium]|nr:GNAT family N-acetyltransferase [Caldilineaceae bacterium]